jgi:hypothetical protein
MKKQNRIRTILSSHLIPVPIGSWDLAIGYSQAPPANFGLSTLDLGLWTYYASRFVPVRPALIYEPQSVWLLTQQLALCHGSSHALSRVGPPENPMFMGLSRCHGSSPPNTTACLARAKRGRGLAAPKRSGGGSHSVGLCRTQ